MYILGAIHFLIKNNYAVEDIDKEIRDALNDYMTQSSDPKQKEVTSHILYYRNQMSAAYKEDERVLKEIIKRHVTPLGKHHVKTLIYYKNKKTSNLIMRNNLQKESHLKCTDVVYQFSCPHEDCKPRHPKVSYIGHTTNTLSKRLTFHTQSGEIQKHMKSCHGRAVSRSDLVENTIILALASSRLVLSIVRISFLVPGGRPNISCPKLRINESHNR